jgi:hypothetical protein
MKYIIIISLLISAGCAQIQADTSADDIESKISITKSLEVDNLIKKSIITKRIADSISRMSDLAINRKVDNQVKVVTVLKYKVVELKQTNEVLKVKIDVLDDVGKPYNLLPISYNEDHR